MAQGTCSKCGTAVVDGTMRENGGAIYCVTCYERNVPVWRRTTDDDPTARSAALSSTHPRNR
jgi:hypothetical protein